MPQGPKFRKQFRHLSESFTRLGEAAIRFCKGLSMALLALTRRQRLESGDSEGRRELGLQVRLSPMGPLVAHRRLRFAAPSICTFVRGKPSSSAPFCCSSSSSLRKRMPTTSRSRRHRLEGRRIPFNNALGKCFHSGSSGLPH